MLCLHIHNDIMLIMHVVFDLGSKIEIICVFYGLQLIDILPFLASVATLKFYKRKPIV